MAKTNAERQAEYRARHLHSPEGELTRLSLTVHCPANPLALGMLDDAIRRGVHSGMLESTEDTARNRPSCVAWTG